MYRLVRTVIVPTSTYAHYGLLLPLFALLIIHIAKLCERTAVNGENVEPSSPCPSENSPRSSSSRRLSPRAMGPGATTTVKATATGVGLASLTQ